MKSEKSLWTSVSILVGTVIAILGLVRGAWQTWLLLGVFAVWGAWVITCLLMPYINRAKRARRRKVEFDHRIRDAYGPIETGGRVSVSAHAEMVMIRHVNLRITAYIRSIYPNATWEWCEKAPVSLVLNGGVGRVKVHGVEDFTHADVKIDQNGNLRCSMVKVVPISDIEGEDPDKNPAPNKQPVDPQIWYETTGRAVLENVIADLNSRGHNQLTLQENGDITIELDQEDVSMEKVTGFPEKVYWPRLVKVFQGEGLAAQVQGNSILVTW